MERMQITPAATTPAATEAIALTEKKINMPLDEIIKLSKKSSSKGRRPMRRPIKNLGPQNANISNRNAKVQRFMESRSSIRQAEFAKRRSSFQGNQFPIAREVAKKAAARPFTNMNANMNRTRFAARSFQRKSAGGNFADKDQAMGKQKPRTLDARFANIREQRMKSMAQQRTGGNGWQSAQQRTGGNGWQSAQQTMVRGPGSAARRNIQHQPWNRAGAPAGARRRFNNYGQ